MEAHLAPMQPTQVNKITSSCEICSGSHDTQYCMENPEQAFVEYASLHTDEAGDARLSKFEADFKRQQSEMTNKINTVLKAITDQMAGALPSDMTPNAHLTPPLQSMLSKHVPGRQAIPRQVYRKPGWGLELNKLKNPNQLLKMNSRIYILTYRLGDLKSFDTLADLGSCVNIIPLYLFKKLNIGLLEETGHIFGLADRTKSYPVGIVKDIEVHIGKLKLLNDFYIIDMKKDPETPLLVGRGFLATANVVIDCRKAKIAVGEGITRSIFRVKGVDLGAQTPYYARKDFLDCHLPEEWEIARDVEINPFKDVLVFRRMVEFIGALPINFKRHMWESKDLIENPINWDKPPKDGDGAWHAKIRIIDPDGKEFTKTL
ncbi:MAK10-like protein [Tanacetum coccineum]